MTRRAAGGVRYLAAAAQDYKAQLRYYAAAMPGLESTFAKAVERTERLAIGNPTGFARIRDTDGARAVVVRRFPFRMIYVIRGDVIVVVALAHTSRSFEALLKRR